MRRLDTSALLRCWCPLETLHPQRSLSLVNNILGDYARNEKLCEARSIFDAMPTWNVISWNTILSAYARTGHIVELKEMLSLANENAVWVDAMIHCNSHLGNLLEARRCFDNLYKRDFVAWISMITAYTKHGHMQSAEAGFNRMPEWTLIAYNVLLGVFLRIKQHEKAFKLFESMPERSIVSYTALVAGYANSGQFERAKYVFEKMPNWNSVAWNGVMAAYAQAGYLAEAKYIYKTKVEKNAVAGTLMITALGTSGDLEDAKAVFRNISRKDVICWNAFLHACMEQERLMLEEVKNTYDKMPQYNLCSSTTMLSAYAVYGFMDEAASIFAAMPWQDSPSWNALLSTYARNGNFTAAEFIFERLPQRDVVAWNSMLSAYVQCGKPMDAKALFDRMPQKDAISWTCVLAAGGKGIDERIPQWSLAMLNVVLARYAHKGDVVKAKAAFDGMPGLDVISWTSLLAGYAQNGHPDLAFSTFRSMNLEGVKPNAASLACVLVSCSYAGSVKDGREYFHSMVVDHGIQPCRDHYSCMVDMLGRAGHLKEAEDLVDNMPFLPDNIVWNCLLATATSHNDVERAKRASKHAMVLDSSQVASYILLSNVWKNQFDRKWK